MTSPNPEVLAEEVNVNSSTATEIAGAASDTASVERDYSNVYKATDEEVTAMYSEEKEMKAKIAYANYYKQDFLKFLAAQNLPLNEESAIRFYFADLYKNNSEGEREVRPDMTERTSVFDGNDDLFEICSSLPLNAPDFNFDAKGKKITFTDEEKSFFKNIEEIKTKLKTDVEEKLREFYNAVKTKHTSGEEINIEEVLKELDLDEMSKKTTKTIIETVTKKPSQTTAKEEREPAFELKNGRKAVELDRKTKYGVIKALDENGNITDSKINAVSQEVELKQILYVRDKNGEIEVDANGKPKTITKTYEPQRIITFDNPKVLMSVSQRQKGPRGGIGQKHIAQVQMEGDKTYALLNADYISGIINASENEKKAEILAQFEAHRGGENNKFYRVEVDTTTLDSEFNGSICIKITDSQTYSMKFGAFGAQIKTENGNINGEKLPKEIDKDGEYPLDIGLSSSLVSLFDQKKFIVGKNMLSAAEELESFSYTNFLIASLRCEEKKNKNKVIIKKSNSKNSENMTLYSIPTRTADDKDKDNQRVEFRVIKGEDGKDRCQVYLHLTQKQAKRNVSPKPGFYDFDTCIIARTGDKEPFNYYLQINVVSPSKKSQKVHIPINPEDKISLNFLAQVRQVAPNAFVLSEKPEDAEIEKLKKDGISLDSDKIFGLVTGNDLGYVSTIKDDMVSNLSREDRETGSEKEGNPEEIVETTTTTTIETEEHNISEKSREMLRNLLVNRFEEIEGLDETAINEYISSLSEEVVNHLVSTAESSYERVRTITTETKDETDDGTTVDPGPGGGGDGGKDPTIIDPPPGGDGTDGENKEKTDDKKQDNGKKKKGDFKFKDNFKTPILDFADKIFGSPVTIGLAFIAAMLSALVPIPFAIISSILFVGCVFQYADVYKTIKEVRKMVHDSYLYKDSKELELVRNQKLERALAKQNKKIQKAEKQADYIIEKQEKGKTKKIAKIDKKNSKEIEKTEKAIQKIDGKVNKKSNLEKRQKEEEKQSKRKKNLQLTLENLRAYQTLIENRNKEQYLETVKKRENEVLEQKRVEINAKFDFMLARRRRKKQEKADAKKQKKDVKNAKKEAMVDYAFKGAETPYVTSTPTASSSSATPTHTTGDGGMTR